MGTQDRLRWDLKHANPSSEAPLVSVTRVPTAAPGALALDLACGGGRHIVPLLDKGYRVVALDTSSVALSAARRAAGSRAGQVLLVHGDVDALCLAASAFDLVVSTNFLDRSSFAAIPSLLVPRGHFLIDTFLDTGSPNASGPRRREFLLQPGELLTAFPSCDTLLYEETRGPTARARFLGRKRNSGPPRR